MATLTQSAPTPTQAEGRAYPAGHEPVHNYLREPARTIWSWMTTVDHKRIGLMYLVSVSAAFAVGGILALLVRAELFTLGPTLMDADTYNKVFTMHGIVMVFMFIVPSIPAALGNFMLPIMIGAKDVAFPRLNLLSFYIYGAWARSMAALRGIFWRAASTPVGPSTLRTPQDTRGRCASSMATLGVFVHGLLVHPDRA